MIAPAALSLRTTSASSEGMRSAKTALAQVVFVPAVSNRSFKAMGMPCRGPRHLPDCRSASRSRACTKACSPITVINALVFGFSFSIRERQVRVSSTGEIFPCRICWEACARVQSLGEEDSGVPAAADAANNAASVSRRVGSEGIDACHYRRHVRTKRPGRERSARLVTEPQRRRRLPYRLDGGERLIPAQRWLP